MNSSFAFIQVVFGTCLRMSMLKNGVLYAEAALNLCFSALNPMFFINFARKNQDYI